MKKAGTGIESHDLWVRVVVRDAPPGVKFAMQRGKSELLEPSNRTETALVFEFSIRAVAKPGSEAPNILGPYAQGPAKDRFLYLNSGTMAGQSQTGWTRRAKLKTAGITWALVCEALKQDNAVLVAEVHGSARDDGPCCGTIPFLNGGWQVDRRGRAPAHAVQPANPADGPAATRSSSERKVRAGRQSREDRTVKKIKRGQICFS